MTRSYHLLAKKTRLADPAGGAAMYVTFAQGWPAGRLQRRRAGAFVPRVAGSVAGIFSALHGERRRCCCCAHLAMACGLCRSVFELAFFVPSARARRRAMTSATQQLLFWLSLAEALACRQAKR